MLSRQEQPSQPVSEIGKTGSQVKLLISAIYLRVQQTGTPLTPDQLKQLLNVTGRVIEGKEVALVPPGEGPQKEQLILRVLFCQSDETNRIKGSVVAVPQGAVNGLPFRADLNWLLKNDGEVGSEFSSQFSLFGTPDTLIQNIKTWPSLHQQGQD